MSKHIILNVPHASVEGVFDKANGWKVSMPYLLQQVNRWTDWFTDYLFASDNPNVWMKRATLSRFVVDVERLVKDPMEKCGQGILYTAFEHIPRDLTNMRSKSLFHYYMDYITGLGDMITCDDDVLIDCHSFPSDIAPDVDICISFNNDWSKPDENLLDGIKRVFEKDGFNVSFNNPYSNSITPPSLYRYKSFMIEINKRCYMDEKTLLLKDDAPVIETIRCLYEWILDSYTNIHECTADAPTVHGRFTGSTQSLY